MYMCFCDGISRWKERAGLILKANLCPARAKSCLPLPAYASIRVPLALWFVIGGNARIAKVMPKYQQHTTNLCNLAGALLMNTWMDGLVNIYVSEWMNVWMYVCMDGWMDGWWFHRWIDIWKHEHGLREQAA